MSVMVSDKRFSVRLVGVILLALFMPVPAHAKKSAPSDCRIQRAISKVEPATVRIAVSTPDGPAYGTGFIWDKSGKVITNHHIVAAGDNPIITLDNGKRLKGTLLADFPERDIAILTISGRFSDFVRIERNSKSGSTAKVITLGNPNGRGLQASTGIVQAFDQYIIMYPGIPLYGLLQTDIQFKPGNSGGAVFNCKGRVIGMAAATLPRLDGKGLAGFVIPADQLIEAVESIDGNLTTRLRLETPPMPLMQPQPNHSAVDGPAPSSPSPVKPRLGLMIVSTPEGRLLVDQVVPGTPAESVGVLPGDIILAANGEPLISLDELLKEVEKKSRSTLRVVVLRDGHKEKFSIKLRDKTKNHHGSHNKS